MLTITDLGRPRGLQGERSAEEERRKLQDRFDQPFQRDDGSLSLENWGLKEIKICSGFLRLRPGWSVSGAKDPTGTRGWDGTAGEPWVQVGWHRYNRAEYLCQQIVLLKPKLALVAGVDFSPETRKALGAVGISTEDASFLASVARHQTFPHQYLLATSAARKQLAADPQALTRLPARVLELTETHQGSDTMTIGRLVDLASGGTDQLEYLQIALAQAWNQKLVRWAGLVTEPQLIIAMNNKDSTEEILCGGRVRRVAENAIPEAILSAPGTLSIAYQRHANTQGLYSKTFACCWAPDTACNHRRIWESMTSYVGLAPNAATDMLRKDSCLGAEQLYQAGLVWVVVVDDRIAEKMHDQEVERRQLARAGTIIVPFRNKKGVEPDELEPKSILRSLRETREMLGSNPGLIFFTAHLGLLKPHGLAQNENWFSAIRETIAAHFPGAIEVATHSGRGKPPELANLPTVRFVEFSNLDTYATQPEGKARLVEMLLAVRRLTDGGRG